MSFKTSSLGAKRQKPRSQPIGPVVFDVPHVPDMCTVDRIMPIDPIAFSRVQSHRPQTSSVRKESQRKNVRAPSSKPVGAKVIVDFGDGLLGFLLDNGYTHVDLRGSAGLCGLHDYLFTCAIVTGLDRFGYFGRYCYESRDEALRAHLAWDGLGDPGGNWLKFKSPVGERLGPGVLDRGGQ